MSELSVNEQVVLLLEKYGYKVAYHSYKGTDTTYIIYNFADERGGQFADDEPQANEYELQVHLYAPKSFNHIKLKEKIKEDLFNNGWTYPDVNTFYEDDTKLFHVVFSCEKTIRRN